VARLPERIDSERRRKVTPDDTLTASWGDPPMVLRCGVGAPPLESPPAPAPQVDGVTWSARKLRDGYLFTTSGRTVFVEMLVPGRYAPEVNPLVDLAPAVRATVPCAPDAPEDICA
jgi:hypothetical protein